MRNRVDLPAPERPMMPSICPAGTSSETASTATLAPKRRVSPRMLRVPSCMGATMPAAAIPGNRAPRVSLDPLAHLLRRSRVECGNRGLDGMGMQPGA